MWFILIFKEEAEKMVKYDGKRKVEINDLIVEYSIMWVKNIVSCFILVVYLNGDIGKLWQIIKAKNPQVFLKGLKIFIYNNSYIINKTKLFVIK